MNRPNTDVDFPAWNVRADFRERDEDSNFSVFRVRRFSEWPEPLHWIAFPVEILTKPLIHWIASPLFTEKPFFYWKVLRRIPFPKIGSENALQLRVLKVSTPQAPRLEGPESLVLKIKVPDKSLNHDRVNSLGGWSLILQWKYIWVRRSRYLQSIGSAQKGRTLRFHWKVLGLPCLQSALGIFLVTFDLDHEISDVKYLVKFGGRTFWPTRQAPTFSGQFSANILEN